LFTVIWLKRYELEKNCFATSETTIGQKYFEKTKELKKIL